MSQYFPPEVAAPAVRVHELAREWVRAGHQVTVLTGFPHHPTGVVPVEYRGFARKFETLDGIRVIRTWLLAAPNVGVLRRSLCYTSFALSAMLSGALYIRRPDVVIATSPQLLVGAAGWLLARVKRCPFVFEVRDLWPEGVASVGAMAEGAAGYRLLRRAAEFLYRSAARIVVVTRSFAKEIATSYGIENDKLVYIPNGVDLDFFRPPAPAEKERARAEFDFGRGFVTVYGGTIGPSQGLDAVLDGFKAADLKGARLLLFGEGAAKAALVRHARSGGAADIEFRGFLPRHMMRRLYWAADCAVVSLQQGGVWDKVLPSKMFEIMACGCPMIGLLDGESAEVASAGGAALVVPRGDAAGFAEALRRLAADETLSNRLSEAGPSFVRENFDRRRLAGRYLNLLEETSCAAR